MKKRYLPLLLTAAFLVGCTEVEEVTTTDAATEEQETVATGTNAEQVQTELQSNEEPATEAAPKTEEPAKQEADPFAGYKLIEVDGGDLSGHREANVVVDIGFGDREYWAYTNEHGQLVRVTADQIVLQNDKTEPVLSTGRYYRDEAKVPGVESSSLDEGHIIAESLGGYRTLFEQNFKNLKYFM